MIMIKKKFNVYGKEKHKMGNIDIKSVEDQSLDDIDKGDLYDSEKEEELIEEDESFVKPEKRKKLRNYVFKLKNDIGKSFIKMGGLFYKIRENELFVDWGFSTFRDYVEKEVNFSYRKAQYLKDIWEKFKVELDAESDVLNEVGWSKTKEIAKVEDPEQRQEILQDTYVSKQDEEQDTPSVNDLSNKARQANNDGDEEVQKVKKIHFNLYEDQRETVKRALKQASEDADSEKRNHLLEMISMHYLSSSFGEQELGFLLDRIEEVFDCEVVAVDPDTGELKYGDVVVPDDDE